MKKIFLTLLCMGILLSGCSQANPSTSTSTKRTDGSENSDVVLTDIYDNLSDENAFDIMKKEDLKSFIEHGTGILYFSFPECPWCQAYIPMLNEVLENSEMRANYYNAK